MNEFVNRFSSANSGELDDHDHNELTQASLMNLQSVGLPTFALPPLPDPTLFLRLHTDDHADPSCRIKLAHGTTTLAFRFQGGVIVAVDSRATMGSYIASGTVKKVMEVNKFLLGTVAGGAGMGIDLSKSDYDLLMQRHKGDCQYWETYLGMHCRLHELRSHERISVAAASKFLSNIMYSYKGMGLSIGTMVCGWDKSGPAIYYVDSDGSRLKGDLFSVGSGSTYAYGVLDQGYRWDLSDEEAKELGIRSIYAAGHRDAYTGNSCNLYHIKESGWTSIGNYDFTKLHFDGSGGRLPEAQGGGYGYGVRTRWSTTSAVVE